MLALDGKSQRQIDKLLAHGETRRVILDNPIRSHLVYMTTWIDRAGTLQKRKDVYNHDSSLRDALRKANTLLTDIHTTPMTANAGSHALPIAPAAG